MNKKKKVIYNLLYSFLGQIITICIGLLLPRLFVINYGSEVNGLINSISQIFVYMALFESGVGAVTLQALYKPIAMDDRNGINEILAATDKYYKKTGTMYFFSLLLLSVIYPLVVSTELKSIQVSLIIFFLGLSNVLLFFFQGKYKIFLQAEGKSYITTNVVTIVTILTNLIKIACIYLGINIVSIMVCGFIVNMIQVVYILIYIKQHYKWIDLKVTPDFESINQKNSMLIHQIAGMVFQNTDVLILTFACDLKVVSIYSVYKLVTNHLYGFLSIGINSISFALGQIFSTNLEKFKKSIDIFETYFSAISFAVYLVCLYLFIPFIRIYTQGFSDSKYIDLWLPWLFIIVELLTLARVPMLNTINYAGHFKLTLPQTITETIINLTVSIVMVFKFGIYGVLIGTIVALLYRTIDVIIYANIKILNRNPLKTFAIHCVNIIVFGVLYFVFMYVVPEIINIRQFVITGAILLVISIVIFVCLQSVIFLSQTKNIILSVKKINKR